MTYGLPSLGAIDFPSHGSVPSSDGYGDLGVVGVATLTMIGAAIVGGGTTAGATAVGASVVGLLGASGAVAWARRIKRNQRQIKKLKAKLKTVRKGGVRYNSMKRRIARKQARLDRIKRRILKKAARRKAKGKQAFTPTMKRRMKKMGAYGERRKAKRKARRAARAKAAAEARAAGVGLPLVVHWANKVTPAIRAKIASGQGFTVAVGSTVHRGVPEKYRTAVIQYLHSKQGQFTPHRLPFQAGGRARFAQRMQARMAARRAMRAGIQPRALPAPPPPPAPIFRTAPTYAPAAPTYAPPARSGAFQAFPHTAAMAEDAPMEEEGFEEEDLEMDDDLLADPLEEKPFYKRPLVIGAAALAGFYLYRQAQAKKGGKKGTSARSAAG